MPEGKRQHSSAHKFYFVLMEQPAWKVMWCVVRKPFQCLIAMVGTHNVLLLVEWKILPDKDPNFKSGIRAQHQLEYCVATNELNN
jgi:hypothetical protein